MLKAQLGGCAAALVATVGLAGAAGVSYAEPAGHTTEEQTLGSGPPIAPGGGPGDDVVVTGDGDDVIRCGPGNDTVRSGRGKDSVSGGSGNDRIFGGPGRDRLFGGPGRDRRRQ